MKKFLITCIILTVAIFAKAQWRLQFQGGPAVSLKPVSKDSLFAAKQQGMHLQLRAVYYWGHLGLGIAAGLLQQKMRSDANVKPPPSFLTGLDTFTVNGGGVRSFYLLAGPEFCFACGHKFKFNLGIRAGVSFIKKEVFQLKDQNVLVYQNELRSKAPFTFNMGFAAHYFFDQHWAVGAMADYHHFNLKVNNRDFRRGINNALVVMQQKDLMNLGFGLTYKF